MFYEVFISIKLALKNLQSNIGRTILSLLGIVIGVTSVIIILSLGAGIRNFVIGQVETFGTDVIEIEIKVPKTKQASAQNVGGMVGGAPIVTLKLEDIEAIGKISNIGAWYTGILSQQITSYQDKNNQTILFGTNSQIMEVDKGTELDVGRMYNDEEDRGLKQVAVLGSKIKDTLFGNSNAIDEIIKIKGQSFRVIGVLKERGAIGGFDWDKMIYLPLGTLQKKIMGVEHVQFAMLNIEDMAKVEQTISEAEEIMRDRHNIDDPEDDDFAIVSIAESLELIDQVFSAINILLLALTSISLIVGGVGIMNVMYVSVAERTFEIGLRKSIGARNSSILKQFLFEAIFLTVLGGLIGIIFGSLISYGAEKIALRQGYFLQFSITLQSILIGFGFSAGVGILFGYYPAKIASRLSPIEAMRKE
ncbi:ABC transporter permease [Patescibacteria group bacterium]